MHREVRIGNRATLASIVMIVLGSSCRFALRMVPIDSLRRMAPQLLVVLLVWMVSGCAGECPCSAKHPANLPTPPAAPAAAAATQPTTKVEWSHSNAAIPVSIADPMWGDATAPVTIVEFSDLECPFCARVEPTLDRIKQTYGPLKVRIVYLHNPLTFHAHAYSAAIAAETVRSIAGSEAFFRFVRLAFEQQKDLSDESYVKWASASGADPRIFRDTYASKKAKTKVDADMALAERIGARGTPGFRINGIVLDGAQPFEKFAALIDGQLAEAAKLIAAGTPKAELYVALTNRNFAAPPKPEEKPSVSAEEDKVVWKMPVMADDPALGRRDAPVTIVVFSDFECPFCGRVEETLKQIREHYKEDVRIVWKDRPLPFHEQALPAAVLGRLVLTRRGNAAFWTLHDRLFAAHPNLTREELEAIAEEYKVPWSDVKASLTKGPVKARLDASEELASDFEVRGTPHFFINGVRLTGAKPFEQFRTVIDAELTRARELLQHGVAKARLYEALTQNGKEPEPPERKAPPIPEVGRPSLGPANAPVVIQEWSDFQCPFCSRVQPTLAALRKEFPNQIRIVWRHLPLPFHKHAAGAAEAAEEVLAQKGNQAFWDFHDKLFQAQSEAEGLSPEKVERMALDLGVDETRFRTALNSHTHRGKIDADMEVAKTIDISGTPAFVINGYFVSGAQPLASFKRVVRRALNDKKVQRK